MGVKVGVKGRKWDGAWRGNTPEYKKAHDRIFKGSKKIKLKKKKEVKEKPGPQLIDSSKMI
jgi:hypothetical protein